MSDYDLSEFTAAALRDEIRHLRTALEASEAKIMAVIQHVPMAYLRRHDQPGATGPTKALNLEAAMRDYAADRLKAIDRIRQLSAALEASDAALATARREGAEAMREALVNAVEALRSSAGPEERKNAEKNGRTVLAGLDASSKED